MVVDVFGVVVIEMGIFVWWLLVVCGYIVIYGGSCVFYDVVVELFV